MPRSGVARRTELPPLQATDAAERPQPPDDGVSTAGDDAYACSTVCCELSWVTPRVRDELEALPAEERARLRVCMVDPSEVALKSLVRIPWLRRLRILQSRSAATDLGPVAQLHDLEELAISAGVARQPPSSPPPPPPGVRSLEPLVSLPRLRTVLLEGVVVPDLAVLARVAHLRELTLRMRSDASIDLAFVSALPELESLTIATWLRVALAPLATSGSLRSLRIEQTPVHDLAPIAAIPNLTRLALRDGRPPARDLRPLARAAKLEALDLQRTPITSLAGLEKLRLRFLDTTGTGLRDVRPLADMTTLESLGVSADVTDLAPLRPLHGLRALDLGGLRVTSLDALGAAPALEVLYVDDVPIRSLAPLVATSLRELHAERSALSNVEALRRATTLETLDLRATRVTSLAIVASWPELRTLRAGGAALTTVAGLDKLARLEDLELEGTNVKDVEPLGRLPSLRWITVPHGTPPSAVERLKRDLPRAAIGVHRGPEKPRPPPLWHDAWFQERLRRLPMPPAR